MSALILLDFKEASHKLFTKQLYTLFVYYFLAGNLSIFYSVYSQGEIFIRVLYFSILIVVLMLLTFIMSVTIKNKNHQMIGYTILLCSFYLSLWVVFSDKRLIISLPLLALFIIMFQTVKKVRYMMLLLIIHLSSMIYLLLSIGPTSINIGFGYYIHNISATLLIGFFIYQKNQLITQIDRQYDDHYRKLKERNGELQLFNQKISEDEATSMNRFKETTLLLNKYEALSEKYHSLIHSSHHGLIDYDISNKVLTFSDKACQLLAIQNHEVMDWSKIADRMNQNDRDHFSQIWSSLIDNLSTFEQIHIQYTHADNHRSHLSFQFNHYTNSTLEKNHIVGLVKDITVEMEQAGKIAYLAFYDHLTDLPNRTKFIELFENELKAKRERHCILCLNADDFKTFNSTNGFDNGNRMLRHMGDALKNTYESAIVSRIYGNTFVISLIYKEALEDDLLYIQSILDHLAILHFNVYNFTCSIGAVIIRNHQLNAEDYLYLSEEVMYQAKTTCKGSYLVITKGKES